MTLIGFFLYFSFRIQAIELTEELYKQVRDVSKEISMLCPEEDCFMLAIGRSPTPIVEYLKRVRPTNLAQLPLSSFRFNPYGVRSSQLTPYQERSFQIYLKSFLPRNWEKSKRIVVFDYIVRGETLFSFGAYLKRYLKTYHKTGPSVTLVGLTTKFFADDIIEKEPYKSYRLNRPLIMTRSMGSVLMDDLQNSLYEEVSEYKGFFFRDMLRHYQAKEPEFTPELNNSIIRSTFIEELERFMEEDKTKCLDLMEQLNLL